MAPTRLPSKSVVTNENTHGLLTHGVTTRSKQMASLKTYKDVYNSTNKRKADSPLKDSTAKRAAFGDITNAFNKTTTLKEPEKEKVLIVKKVTVETKVLPSAKSTKQQVTNGIAQVQNTKQQVTNGIAQVNGKPSKTKQLQKVATSALESVQKHFTKDPPKPVATRAQNGILKNIEKRLSGRESQNGSIKSNKSDMSGEPSLYTTALENSTPDPTKEEYKVISEKLDKVVLDDSEEQYILEEKETPHKVPEGVADFDLDNWNDALQVSPYAMDIFNYLKSRERLFPIDDYLTRIPGVTVWMRALLVDWMVEVQESFELNHETLYLAVKLVDLFLTKTSNPKESGNPRGNTQKQIITKEELQLLGASSLFIAAKFDERVPPLVDDFLYICDGAYTLQQLLTMEKQVLRAVDFDLGIPLSYRFLRRYARCARVSMPTLTLARFVLELCLLEYALVPHSDSKMAAAALYLALRMKSVSGWSTTLQYYTGYTVKEILPIALAQNATLHKKPKTALSTVRNKYSHTIFFEVAKVPLIDDAILAS